MAAVEMTEDREQRKIRFDVEGMTCAGCAARLQKALEETPGVINANVNISLNRADIAYDPEQIDPAGLAARVGETGYAVKAEPVQFDISGMTCAGCAAKVERAIRAVPGVVDASVNLPLERADVRFAAGADPDLVVRAVADAGYSAHPREAGKSKAEKQAEEDARAEAAIRRESIMLAVAAVLSTPLVLKMVFSGGGLLDWLSPTVEWLLATPVQFIVGAPFYRNAWNAVRHRTANMDVLVVLGTTVTYLYSLALLLMLGEGAEGRLYFETSAVLITFILAGRILEARAKRGTTAAIRELMALRPEEARLLRDGKEVMVGIEEVATGDIVLIKPGEKVPVDGEIVSGESALDESLITGESVPVRRKAGDMVACGAINGEGVLQVRATAVGEDSSLARIVRLVENAQSGKAPVQRLVDRISAVFVPVIIALSALTFIGWFAFGGGLENALIAAVSVLVIACPCALGLATPTALVAGTGSAARHGILIKDIEALERAHRVDLVVFDKTGTLTEGKPAVQQISVVGDWDENTLLRLCAAAQQGSEHPLARAILATAEEAGIDLPPYEDFKAVPGLGVQARVGDRQVLCGNAEFMEEAGIDLKPVATLLAAVEEQAQTPSVVAVDGQVAGVIAIADTIRPTARQAIALLKKQKVRTALLSGDMPAVAARVAEDLGLDSYRGKVRPGDKANEVEKYRRDGHVVAMVGDGVNDAPALAAADVGIAMGSGTDVAMETASITLMRSEPRLVSAALDVSRATWRKIRQNLFWAFIYNLIGIPLAMAGILSPALAGLAMALSSASVVSSSLLLRFWKPKFGEA